MSGTNKLIVSIAQAANKSPSALASALLDANNKAKEAAPKKK